MSKCQPIGDVKSRLILDLFRRLPGEKQKAYLEGLQTCLKMEDCRKAGLILKDSDTGYLENDGNSQSKSPGAGKLKDNAV